MLLFLQCLGWGTGFSLECQLSACNANMSLQMDKPLQTHQEVTRDIGVILLVRRTFLSYNPMYLNTVYVINQTDTSKSSQYCWVLQTVMQCNHCDPNTHSLGCVAGVFRIINWTTINNCDLADKDYFRRYHCKNKQKHTTPQTRDLSLRKCFYGVFSERGHSPCSSRRSGVRSDTQKPCLRTRDTSRPSLRHKNSPSFLTGELRRRHAEKSQFHCNLFSKKKKKTLSSIKTNRTTTKLRIFKSLLDF